MRGGMNSALGWLLMLAVLAVPSFLFYNWWSKNRLPAEARAAEGGASFPAVEAAPGAASPAQSELKPPPVAGGSPLPPSPPSVTPEAAPPDSAAGAPADQQVSAARPPQVSSPSVKASGYNPRTDRNPMLSRDEHRRIKAEMAARAEEERAARTGFSRKPAERGIETRIALQGIVGNAAIINGDMYSAGQSIYGGKILKVGPDYVIIEHRGKRIVKKMQ
jgi:hypothetical protein